MEEQEKILNHLGKIKGVRTHLIANTRFFDSFDATTKTSR
jgi:hypothetical protein